MLETWQLPVQGTSHVLQPHPDCGSLCRIAKLKEEAQATMQKADSKAEAARVRLSQVSSLSSGGRQLAIDFGHHPAPVSTGACAAAASGGAADEHDDSDVRQAEEEGSDDEARNTPEAEPSSAAPAQDVGPSSQGQLSASAAIQPAQHEQLQPATEASQQKSSSTAPMQGVRSSSQGQLSASAAIVPAQQKQLPPAAEAGQLVPPMPQGPLSVTGATVPAQPALLLQPVAPAQLVPPAPQEPLAITGAAVQSQQEPAEAAQRTVQPKVQAPVKRKPSNTSEAPAAKSQTAKRPRAGEGGAGGRVSTAARLQTPGPDDSIAAGRSRRTTAGQKPPRE